MTVVPQVQLVLIERRADIAARLRRAVQTCPRVTLLGPENGRAVSQFVDALLMSPIEAEKWGSRPRTSSEILRVPPDGVAARTPPFVVVAIGQSSLTRD